MLQLFLSMLLFNLIVAIMVETTTILLQYINRCNYINSLTLSVIAVGGMASVGCLKLTLSNLAWTSIWKHPLHNSVHLFISTFGHYILESNDCF